MTKPIDETTLFGKCDECKFEWFPDVPSEEIHADGCSKGKRPHAPPAEPDCKCPEGPAWDGNPESSYCARCGGAAVGALLANTDPKTEGGT